MAKGLFGFMKPVPDAPRIADVGEMRKTYKYWRLRSMCAILIGLLFWGTGFAICGPQIT